MLTLLKYGGLTTGGTNFDAKCRRESFEPVDLFHAHIGGMDAFARGLKIAAAIRKDGRLAEFVKNRYSSWDSGHRRADREGQGRLQGTRPIRPQAGRGEDQPERPPGIPREPDQRVYLIAASWQGPAGRAARLGIGDLALRIGDWQSATLIAAHHPMQ
jgi:hypothetical protein